MSVDFALELRIFVIMGITNDVCYFILKMFVMIKNINDV